MSWKLTLRHIARRHQDVYVFNYLSYNNDFDVNVAVVLILLTL